MNHICFGAPEGPGAISAEEYAASLGGGCPCAGAQTAAASGERTVCCTVAPAPPVVPQAEEGCCCKQGFRAALGLLCSNEAAELLNFAQAAFVTDSFVAGAALTAPAAGAQSADNLGTELSGVFRRFSPCSCDLLDISAVPNYPAVGAATALPFTATQLSICQLTALVIAQQAATAEGDLTAAEVAARNFRRLKRYLSARLNPCASTCNQCACSCGCEECCCAAGVLAALGGSNLSRRVTLTAGYLALSHVELLGTVGKVMVLASDETARIYFVCAADVAFLA